MANNIETPETLEKIRIEKIRQIVGNTVEAASALTAIALAAFAPLTATLIGTGGLAFGEIMKPGKEKHPVTSAKEKISPEGVGRGILTFLLLLLFLPFWSVKLGLEAAEKTLDFTAEILGA